MKIFCTVIILFVWSSSYSQTSKGTHVIIAICKDGILIGADSRLGLSNHKSNAGDIDGYTDNIQKIFGFNNFIMGLMGEFEMRDFKTLYSLTNGFNARLSNDTTLQAIGAKWYNYALENNLTKLRTVFGHYENNKPLLAFVHGTLLKTLTASSNFLESDSSGFETEYSEKLSCKKTALLIRKYILRYAKVNDAEKYVGGTVYFLKISKNNKISWLENKPPKQYEDVRDIWKAYKRGEKKFIFIEKNGEKNLDSWLNN